MDAWLRGHYKRAVLAVVPLAVVIIAGIAYHLVQKAAGGVNPWPMLAIAYGSAFVATLVIALASSGTRWEAGRGEWGAGIVLGLAALGIEAGFFFLYRSGWPLASASVIANIAVNAVLAIVAIVAFHEHISAARAAGLVLAAAATLLIARG